ncbi:L,D-transpeptidase [Bacteroidales bacterium OttesenSCG-928-B11]|nr:L,D-transpeptidase [Bacteroidales bacterium OttesenSCG-928-C03]MDL2311735.1 L,D-transpeptidase [Bacteroidales bacterium OttesenSCG-928-B11]MDL2325441.1 L,D-transpeptidase [Bacteroidales bacterium OttesenSCG-928-A14]
MKQLIYFFALLILLVNSCTQKSNHKQLVLETTVDTTVLKDTLPVEPVITISLKKELLYDKYTLLDTYPYKDTVRHFQWDQVEKLLKTIEKAQLTPTWWGVVRNRQNINGEAELTQDAKRNRYGNMEDEFGVERFQSAPLFNPGDTVTPIRYAEDGSLLRVIKDTDSSAFLLVEHVYIGGEWMVPKKFVKLISDTVTFSQVVFVDRTNQNIAAIEKKSQGEWLIRSMNPATTGVKRPPYQHETPLGIFVVQEKKVKMYFLVDGTNEIAGYSPHASRFSNGGYIHGIPVNYPRQAIIEYSNTLGTIPRSHKCVRNASSHAEFIFNWAPTEQSLVVVIE